MGYTRGRASARSGSDAERLRSDEESRSNPSGRSDWLCCARTLPCVGAVLFDLEHDHGQLYDFFTRGLTRSVEHPVR